MFKGPYCTERWQCTALSLYGKVADGISSRQTKYIQSQQWRLEKQHLRLSERQASLSIMGTPFSAPLKPLGNSQYHRDQLRGAFIGPHYAKRRNSLSDSKCIFFQHCGHNGANFSTKILCPNNCQLDQRPRKQKAFAQITVYWFDDQGNKKLLPK